MKKLLMKVKFTTITETHYGNKKYLQARYVWKNALNLENIELEKEKSIQQKILNGPNLVKKLNLTLK